MGIFDGLRGPLKGPLTSKKGNNQQVENHWSVTPYLGMEPCKNGLTHAGMSMDVSIIQVLLRQLL